MNQIRCKVSAFWDDEAAVWVASSNDVPGLATEADTLEALSVKLRLIVPEFLQLNNVISEDQKSKVFVELTSQKIVEISVDGDVLQIGEKPAIITLNDLLDSLPEGFQYPKDVEDFASGEPIGREIL